MALTNGGSDRALLKALLVGDVHLGPDSETRPGEEAHSLLERFVELANREIRPDLVIEMGDRINNRSHELDNHNAREMGSILRGLASPCYYIVGNHDVHYLSKEENAEIFGSSVIYRTQTAGDYRLVFLDTVDPVIEHVGGSLSGRQIDWLSSVVQADDMPKIVVGHHPLDGLSATDSPHFVRFPEYAFMKDGEKVRKVLKAGHNVVAYLSGHVHWFNFIVDHSFSQISVPSFTEAWPETRNAPGMFAEVRFFGDGRLEVTVRSLAPERILGRFSWQR